MTQSNQITEYKYKHTYSIIYIYYVIFLLTLRNKVINYP